MKEMNAYFLSESFDGEDKQVVITDATYEEMESAIKSMNYIVENEFHRDSKIEIIKEYLTENKFNCIYSYNT